MDRNEYQREWRKNNPDKVAAAKQRYKQAHPEVIKAARKRYKQTHKESYKIRSFRGVDGEGGNVNGRHVYTLLTAGERHIVNDGGLTTLECLEFLTSLSPYHIYVGYFFDYDTTMILKDLPLERMQRLLTPQARTFESHGRWTTLPIEWEGYEFDYLPRKFFKVRKLGAKQWIMVNDVGTFFQTSFVKALRLWGVGTEEQLQQISSGKDQRRSFGALEASTVEYNALEIVLLQELMTKFRDVLLPLGLVPQRWQGPGFLASRMLHKNGIPSNKLIKAWQIGNKDLLDFARKAYYGGWFEVSMIGHYKGKVYEADINSAYPYAMLQLPCLEHAKYREVDYLPAWQPGQWYLADISFKANRLSPWYSFPIRRPNGSIYRPGDGRGWYTNYEIEKRLDCQDVQVHRTFIIRSNCRCQPFEFMKQAYIERKRMGKDSAGIAFKYAINSVYGKLVQSIGHPKYSNPIWGSLLVGYTRSMLLDAIREYPESILMVATDAVYSTRGLKLDYGSGLGQWELKEHDRIHIVQPGVYFTETGHAKTRGVNQNLLVESEKMLLDSLPDVIHHGKQPDVSLTVNKFMGMRTSLVRNNTEDIYGQWIEESRRVSYDFTSKREKIAYVDGDAAWLTPYKGSLSTVTVPYSKDIGALLDLQRIQAAEEDLPDELVDYLSPPSEWTIR